MHCLAVTQRCVRRGCRRRGPRGLSAEVLDQHKVAIVIGHSRIHDGPAIWRYRQTEQGDEEIVQSAEATVPTRFHHEQMDRRISAGIARHVIDPLETDAEGAVFDARHELPHAAAVERHHHQRRIVVPRLKQQACAIR